MIKKLICLTAFAASLFPLAGHAQMLDKGNMNAFLVRGDVTLIDNSTGESKPLSKGDTFKDNTTVVTGDNSTAVILFSNGSSVAVRPNSELDIENFQQEPFDPAKGTFLTLTEDPSMSRTQLALDNGTIAGETKKLSFQSEYNVRTPLGSAGIRGTKWATSVTSEIINGEPVYTVVIAKENGEVVYSTPVSTGEVSDGEEVVIRGTVDANGNVVIDEIDTSTITDPAILAALEDLNNVVTSEDADLIITPAGDTEDPALEISPTTSGG